MSEETIAELIRNLPGIIGAFGSVITACGVILVGYWAYRSQQVSEGNAAILQHTSESLETVKATINGMSHELVTETKAAAHAEGQLIGRDAERERAENSGLAVDVPVRVKVVKPDIQG